MQLPTPYIPSLGRGHLRHDRARIGGGGMRKSCHALTGSSTTQALRATGKSTSPHSRTSLVSRRLLMLPEITTTTASSVRASSILASTASASVTKAAGDTANCSTSSCVELRICTLSGDVMATYPVRRKDLTQGDLQSLLLGQLPLEPGLAYILLLEGQVLHNGVPLSKLAPGIDFLQLVAVKVNDNSFLIFERARNELNQIRKKDLLELQGFAFSTLKPPIAIELLMEAICAVLRIPAERQNTWEESKRKIADPFLFEQILSFDPRIDPQNVFVILAPFVENANFQVFSVQKMSRTFGLLCEWCHALCEYGKSRTCIDVSSKRAYCYAEVFHN